MDTISLYTDGSCSVRDKSGGWAYIGIFGDKFVKSYGFESDTTVNRMELTAIIQALAGVEEGQSPLRIFSDSEYCVNCANVWAARWELMDWHTPFGDPIKNADLVKSLHEWIEYHKCFRAVSLSWVRGHNKNPYNEVADLLCGDARTLKIEQRPLDSKVCELTKHYKNANGPQFITYRNDNQVITKTSPSLEDLVGEQLFLITGKLRRKKLTPCIFKRPIKPRYENRQTSKP